MNITFRQLRYFIAVAEARSISGGAANVGISQSAVTDAIRFLEAEAGFALFTRHAKGVILTRDGHQFMRHARKIVESLAAIRSGMGETCGQGVGGTLLIGCTPLVTGYFLSDLLARYRQAVPDVTVKLVEDRSETLEHMLVNGELHLALLMLPGLTRPEALDHEILLRSEVRAWLPPTHHLASRDSLALADLADEALVALNRDELVNVNARAAQAFGHPLHIAYRSVSVEAVRGLVATGAGIALMPDLAYRPWSLEGDRILAKRMRDPLPTVDIGLVHRRLTPHGEAAHLFMETARGNRTPR